MSLIPLIKYDEKTPPNGSDLKSAITGCNVGFNGTALTKLQVLLSKNIVKYTKYKTTQFQSNNYKKKLKILIIHNTTHDKKKPTTDKISTNSSMTF